jgi:hypothetical protein
MRGAVDPERTDFAPRHEHHMPAHHLKPPGAGSFGGQIDRGGFEHDVLRPDVQCRVGRRELEAELGQHPMPVAAFGCAERFPQRRQVGRVLDD